MEWKKLSHIDELPKDRQFLALWKGVPCIAEWDEEMYTWWICFYPGVNGDFPLHQERWGKFTHWCEIILPEDY